MKEQLINSIIYGIYNKLLLQAEAMEHFTGDNYHGNHEC